jgi:hypothetical protein
MTQRAIASFFGRSCTAKALWLIKDLLKSRAEQPLEWPEKPLKLEADQEHLTEHDMELPIPAEHITQVLNLVQNWHIQFHKKICITTTVLCDLCQQPRIAESASDDVQITVDDSSNLCYDSVLDFLSELQRTVCCDRRVCKPCWRNHFKHAISSPWWLDLAAEDWLDCPMGNCRSGVFDNFSRVRTNRTTRSNMVFFSEHNMMRMGIPKLDAVEIGCVVSPAL